ncbi:MAG: hypothetical protein ABSD31_13605 [Candidatus Binataceae bacterium]|jgi:hypothetical protein
MRRLSTPRQAADDYDPDNGGDAIRNGWRPERETLEAWRERRRAHWRVERDRVLAGLSPI